MKKQAGFTLLELAIVMTISGVLMVAAIRAYLVYLQDAKYYAMVDKVNTIKQTLGNFNSNTAKKRYPCPADPSLPITDANAGVEATSVVGGVTVCWAMDPINAVAVGSCNTAGKPFANSKAGSICRYAGARDTLADAETVTADTIEIGGLPYRSMKAGTSKQDMNELTMADALDPWGYQFTYAITEAAATQNNKGQGTWGAIDVRSESTTTAAGSGVELALPPQSANYVVVGHGADHNGAYNASGLIVAPCGAVPDPGFTTGAEDNFNCNNTSGIHNIFINGLRSDASGAQAAYHNDDYIAFASGYIASLWEFTQADPNDIYNLNDGGVGVGASAMAQSSVKLQVQSPAALSVANAVSNLACNGGTCWTPSIDTVKICDSITATNCFDPVIFGGYDASATTGATNTDNPYKNGSGTIIGPAATNTYQVTGAAASNNQCPANANTSLTNVVTGLNGTTPGTVKCTSGSGGITAVSPTADLYCPGADTGAAIQTYVVGITATGLLCARIDNTNCVSCTTSSCTSAACP